MKKEWTFFSRFEFKKKRIIVHQNVKNDKTVENKCKNQSNRNDLNSSFVLSIKLKRSILL